MSYLATDITDYAESSFVFMSHRKLLCKLNQSFHVLCIYLGLYTLIMLAYGKMRVCRSYNR